MLSLINKKSGPSIPYPFRLPLSEIQNPKMMLERTVFIVFILLLLGCTKPSNESSAFSASDAISKIAPTLSPVMNDIFPDSSFTFIELDSISEEMLEVDSAKSKKYISQVKKMKKEHYQFFHYNGPDGSFWDDYFFLVSRQKSVKGVRPIIIHTSLDFGFYTSTLFTLNSSNEKLDSVVVASAEFSSGGDTNEDDIIRIWSTFRDEYITSTQVNYVRFGTDSLVTIDSTIYYLKIRSNGLIDTINMKKFNVSGE
jgi:hypothetical protein